MMKYMRYVKKEIICWSGKWNSRLKKYQRKWGLHIILYICTLLFAGLSLYQVIINNRNYETIVYYVVAAISIFFSSYFLYFDLRYHLKNKVRSMITQYTFIRKFTKDYYFRTIITAYCSLAFNLLFAIFNGVYGIIEHSIWFGGLSAYYIGLSFMRFYVTKTQRFINVDPQIKQKRENHVYRICGMLLLLLTIALTALVYQMVLYDQGKSYSDIIIYVVALYTFIKVILSIYNIVKTRKLNSLLLQLLRNISYVDAMVSILLLQSAMFSSFGKEGDLNHQLMNGITGICVCLIILITSIYVLYKASKFNEDL